METYAHIISLGVANGTDGRTATEYQITLNAGDSSWARAFADEQELQTFLETGLALRRDLVEQAVRQLREAGHATIHGVELSEREAPALGLEHSSIDF